VVIATFAVIAYVFTVAPFSFGYLLAFNFYMMVFGYLWLNHFSDLNYDHRLGALSATVSAIAFLVPELFITSPIRRRRANCAAGFVPLTTALLSRGAAMLFLLWYLAPRAMFEHKAETGLLASHGGREAGEPHAAPDRRSGRY
jgi:hypothetical protein